MTMKGQSRMVSIIVSEEPLAEFVAGNHDCTSWSHLEEAGHEACKQSPGTLLSHEAPRHTQVVGVLPATIHAHHLLLTEVYLPRRKSEI